jgi:hypothetical protein
MTAEKSKDAKEKKCQYQRTPRDMQAVERIVRQPASPRLKISESSQLVPDHPDEQVGISLLMEAIGTTDPDFALGFLGQLGELGDDKNNEARLNFMLSVVKGIKPRDHIEAMLAAQMAATHAATMKLFRDLAEAPDLQHRDSAERTLNKLMRTFATLVEALKRHRAGGEQTVTVHQVNVGEGGRAIVGNVTQGPRDMPANGASAPPLALTHDDTLPMPSLGSVEKAALIPATRPKARK